MNNDKRFEGLWNATAEKRYNHFITYAVDYESTWLLASEDGFATIDVDGYIHLLVWPSKEFAEAYNKEDTPVEMDIHEFCERCEEMMNDENMRYISSFISFCFRCFAEFFFDVLFYVIYNIYSVDKRITFFDKI